MSRPETKPEAEHKPKELWEVYNVGDFIDAKDNQSDWRVGYIIDKNNNTRFYKVRFDGWGAKYDEFYKFNSAKLVDFRSVVIGYTGQKKNAGLRSDWKFSMKWHTERAALFEEFVASTDKTAWEINQFLRGHNYFYTDFLMTESYDKMEEITAVMDYFLANTRMVIRYLKSVDPEFIQYYRSQQIPEESHLVDANSARANSFYEVMDTLYIISGSYARLDGFFTKNAALLRKYLNIDFEKNVKRYYQLRIFEQVLKEGGLNLIGDLICSKLSNANNVIPFLFLKSLSALYIGLTNQQQYVQKKDYLNKLVEITNKNSAKLDDKYMKDINKAHFSDLLQTLKSAYEFSDDEQDVKNWALEEQVRFYEKMVNCPYFDKKLKGVIGFQELVEKNKMQPNANAFIEVLLKHKIFDCLFSADNAEIIRKGVDFCKTLCYNEMFPFEVAFRIWELREGKHEAALQEIYSLMAALPSKIINHGEEEKKLFEEISKQPRDQWDEDYIKMIKEFSLTAVGWVAADQKNPQKYGYQILYTNALLKKTEFAINSFIQLLSRFEKTEVMDQFINECFTKIEKNEESYTYVIFLLKVIDDHLSDFKEATAKATSCLVADLINNSHDPLEKSTKRFELLSHVAKLTNTNILFEEFIQLWSNYKGKSAEKAFYDWVLNKKQGERLSLNLRIGSDIRRQIFETIWCPGYDYSQMSEKQCTIFIEFFKATNIYEQKLKRTNLIIKTEDLDLVGMDKIWQAFLANQNEGISSSLAELIVEVHMCPSKLNEEEKENWTRTLIGKFSQQVTSQYEAKNIDQVRRLLLLPYKIIERDEQIFSAKPVRNYIMKQYKILNPRTKEEKYLKFNFGGLAYDFKRLAAEKFKVPFRRCRLTCKGEQIKYENYFKTLVECSFNNAPFELEVIQDEVPSVKGLLNSELEIFFNLLGDPQIEKNVWDIIQRLPIAQDFLAKLEKSEHPWDEINNQSIYKELYILRVMGYMSKNWWAHFLEGPGLSNLSEKFGKVSSKTKVQKQYLKVLAENVEKSLEFYEQIDLVCSQKLINHLWNSLKDLLENCSQTELHYRKHGVQIQIVSSIFKIFKRLQGKTHALNVLIGKQQNIIELLSNGLMMVKNEYIRKQFMFKLKSISEGISRDCLPNYLHVVYNSFFNLATSLEASDQTSQYFDYASSLIQMIDKQVFEAFLQATNKQIVREVERRLYLSPSEVNSETVSHQLVGYLLLMRKLISFCSPEEKERVSNFLLYKCFFPHLESQNADILTKTKESKSAAFDLLGALVAEGLNSLKLLDILSNLHKCALWRTRRGDDWTLTPGQKIKSASGYVGIKNLGCICYMNSFFQQIFMIPNFRHAVLQCEDPLEEREIPTENVLYQLKKMFFSLIHSEKKYYVPKQFCHSFKNYEGQPTNVFQQMDIDQFSGILFDKLQNQIKGTRYENIIKDFFGGVFSNQIICKGCPHFSETEESFLSISLSVKTKKNIYQSFDTMIKGDTLDGDNAYFCERCNKKVPAVKRVCLKKLPDHLILTLKRFEFDFQTMSKNKLNDYCEFPTELNVKQYSQQYLRKQENPDRFEDEEMVPDSYYDYTLQGVVIHSGHADSGHYYSFIRERKEDGKWFEFNDTIVRPFDIRRLSQQAFGGEISSFEVKEKIKNAYMLIYERKKKLIDHSSLINPAMELTEQPIYAQLKEEIQKSNTEQKIENILFSTEYTKFAANLIKAVDSMDEQTAIQSLKYITLVYLTVTIREKEEITAFDFLKGLHKQILKHPEIINWIVRIFSAQKTLVEFFKNNPAKEVKKLLAHWLTDLARSAEQTIKLEFAEGLLVYIVANAQNSPEMCQILYELMEGADVKEYLIPKHIAGSIIENLLGKERGSYRSTVHLKVIESCEEQIGKEIAVEKTTYELSKKVKYVQDTPYVWALLSRILEVIKAEEEPVRLLLPKEQLELFYLAPNFIYKQLSECKNKLIINKICRVLTLLAENNQKYSDEMLNLCSNAFKEFESKRYRQFFVMLGRMLEIKDQLSEHRAKRALDVMLKALKENEKYTLDSNIIQQWIAKLVSRSKNIQQMLGKMPETLKYLTQVAVGKLPTEDICRKHYTFQENTVNKFHGIKMCKNRKGYELLSRTLESFYVCVERGEQVPQEQWDSEQDLSEQPLKAGDTVAYFDAKQKVEFVEARVDEVFLTRVWLSVNKTKVAPLWQDDEKLASIMYPFNEVDSDDEMVDSENTTEMENDSEIQALSLLDQ